MTSVSLHNFPLRSPISRSQLGWYSSAATELKMKRPVHPCIGRFFVGIVTFRNRRWTRSPRRRRLSPVSDNLRRSSCGAGICMFGDNADPSCGSDRINPLSGRSIAACPHPVWSRASWHGPDRPRAKCVPDPRLQRGSVAESLRLFIGSNGAHHTLARQVPETGESGEVDALIGGCGGKRFHRFCKLAAPRENHAAFRFQTGRSLADRHCGSGLVWLAQLWMSPPWLRGLVVGRIGVGARCRHDLEWNRMCSCRP